MASTNPTPGLPRTNNSPNAPRLSYYMNGKVFIVAGIILVVIVFFIVAFHVYVRVFWRRRRHLTPWHHNLGSHDTPLTGGLDKAVVNSLPTFTYTTPPLYEGGNVKDAAAGVVECAVCLIEFQENDSCRLLPKCNHSFHTECIDKWFLSNITCPLCRTSADPVDSDDVLDAESSTAFSLPQQDVRDHIRRSNSSPSDCLLPQQDSGSHIQRQDVYNDMQRSRSSSPLGGELEGAGLHVRRMLARTCSSRVNARYDLVGEDMHNDTMIESMYSERNGNMGRDRARRNHTDEAFVQHLQLPSWQRSVSDRSLNVRQGMQFPSNVLFWGNHSHVDSRLHRDHWQVGGRSLPHITIDVSTPQASVLMPRHTLSRPSECLSPRERPCVVPPSVQRQPSRMNSLKREESGIHLAQHGMHRCGDASSNM